MVSKSDICLELKKKINVNMGHFCVCLFTVKIECFLACLEIKWRWYDHGSVCMVHIVVVCIEKNFSVVYNRQGLVPACNALFHQLYRKYLNKDGWHNADCDIYVRLVF